MNIICKIIGHSWDKTDKYHQDCKRKYCLSSRYLAIDWFKYAYGEKYVNWHIIDIGALKIK